MAKERVAFSQKYSKWKDELNEQVYMGKKLPGLLCWTIHPYL